MRWRGAGLRGRKGQRIEGSQRVGRRKELGGREERGAWG